MMPKSLRAIQGLFLELLESRTHWSADVLTYHNDLDRTGQDLNDTTLTPANVNVKSFGKLFTDHVDGQVYAQPLYMGNVAIPGKGTHNLVFVATENDSVYAFDANGDSRKPIWHTSFLGGPNHARPVPFKATGTNDLSPVIGITSTPVIDPNTGTLYVLAKTQESTSGHAPTYVQRLHALDITTGLDRLAATTISATLPGSGDASDGNGDISFDPLKENQRSGLALVNGVIYIAWASHGDNNPYHGWLMGYDENTLQQVFVFNDTPNGGQGGIWMSGGAIAADQNGDLYLATGNGTFEPSNTTDWGNSVLHLTTSNGLTVVDSFTPQDQQRLNDIDNDLGSGGVLLLPDQSGNATHELVDAGKDGTIYLINRDAGRMGGYDPNADHVVEELTAAIGSSFDTPAYFNGSVYYHGVDDVLKAFALDNGLLSTSATSSGQTNFGFPGSTPSISANGDQDGIVWEVELRGKSAILHASDAGNVGTELYNSNQSARDHIGAGVKFAVPTIADGQVFVGGASTLSIFGERPAKK